VQLVSRGVVLGNVVGARIAMSLERVVIDYCAFSVEHCKQFIQFVVRHEPLTSVHATPTAGQISSQLKWIVC